MTTKVKRGGKKSKVARESETTRELCGNIRKALRLDTGGVDPVDAFIADAAEVGIRYTRKQAAHAVKWTKLKMSGPRVSQNERLSIIEKRHRGHSFDHQTN